MYKQNDYIMQIYPFLGNKMFLKWLKNLQEMATTLIINDKYFLAIILIKQIYWKG